MRICFFTHYKGLYGANRSLLNLIDGLKTLGVQSFVIAPVEGALTDELRGRNVPYAIFPLQWWSSEHRASKNTLKKIRERFFLRRYALKKLITNLKIIPPIVRQLKEWQIQVLYTNSSIIPVGALASLWMGKPHVWHLREFGKEDYNLTLDWGKATFNFLMKQATAQICVSCVIQKYYEKALVRGKNYVVYNGIATQAEFDRLREKSHYARDSNDNYIFAIVGLIHSNKSQDLAISALALLKKEFPNVSLKIAGEGDVNTLRILAKNLGVIDNVDFLGYVSNPFEVYLQSDALLMCSKHEAMGRVTVEAMAASKPVIGFDNAGTHELIEHEKTGLLFKGDAEELAICMKRFVKKPAWAKTLGERGWKIAREKYCTETYSKNIYDVLRENCNEA